MSVSSRKELRTACRRRSAFSTMDSLRLFMDEEAVADTEAAYMEDGDLYVLDPHVDKETREKLNEDFGKPMLILAGLTEGGEETEGMLSAMGLPEGTDPLQAIMQMPEEARDQMTSAMEEQIGEMPESIVTQAAVSFVGAEYEAIGEDVDAIQMDYIISAASA